MNALRRIYAVLVCAVRGHQPMERWTTARRDDSWQIIVRCPRCCVAGVIQAKTSA